MFVCLGVRPLVAKREIIILYIIVMSLINMFLQLSSTVLDRLKQSSFVIMPSENTDMLNTSIPESEHKRRRNFMAVERSYVKMITKLVLIYGSQWTS
ncbi:hypothetical protein Ahia01_000783000 [Argonauta hians]